MNPDIDIEMYENLINEILPGLAMYVRDVDLPPALAEKYEKNAGQIILRFETQEGFITLPKSTNPARIKSNLNIFDFTLTEDETEAMRALDTGKTSHNPDADGVGEYLLHAFKIED